MTGKTPICPRTRGLGPTNYGLAMCPLGWFVTGGGADRGSNQNGRLHLIQSRPVTAVTGQQGWKASADGKIAGGTVWRVFAICVH